MTESETDPYRRRVGFLQPNLPDLDLAAWQRGSRQDRMRPLVRHFCEVGFGSPDVVTLVYVVKIGVYVLVGWLFILSTPGIDGFFVGVGLVARADRLLEGGRLDDAVRGARARLRFGPLNLRFTPADRLVPLLAAARARSGSPPWPGRVPLHRGGTRGRSSTSCCTPRCVVSLAVRGVLGELPRWQVYVAAADCWPLLGLRDKTIFLAARSEHYLLTAALVPVPAGDQVVAAPSW